MSNKPSAARQSTQAEQAVQALNKFLARIVLLDHAKCKPNTPAFDYLRKQSGLCDLGCISVIEGKCAIKEDACPACLNRAKRCPSGAVRIANIPHSLAPSVTYRYGTNAFKLHRLPVPRTNAVLGLVGTNGIGKSTALRILAGHLMPNLGRVDASAGAAVDWTEALAHFRGSELQAYFTRLLDHEMCTVTKLQYVEELSRQLADWSVRDLLQRKDSRGVRDAVTAALDLGPIGGRMIGQLSGGELQRVALALVLVQRADVYLFDEPSSYLDVAQRLKAARAIRGCVGAQTYVVAVEHDLAVLDYLSDSVCLFYGARGAYGVASATLGTREGVNAFLSGYLPTENLRFRAESLHFKPTAEPPTTTTEAHGASQSGASESGAREGLRYPSLQKRMGDFSLHVEGGLLEPEQVVVLLGQNVRSRAPQPPRSVRVGARSEAPPC